jgi:hypothetical protein
MWLGGGEADGQTLAAYQFRKQSCVQTAPPCGARTLTNCESTADCRWGSCVPAPGSNGFCEGLSDFQCLEEPDCTWIPDQCAPSGAPVCDFHQCEELPGCVLGPPVARCAGDAWCGVPEVNSCAEPGCFLSNCLPLQRDALDCAALDVYACEEAPGCTTDGVECQGVTHCSAQTDPDRCISLGCQPEPFCGGRPTRDCASLSIAECETLTGCSVQW